MTYAALGSMIGGAIGVTFGGYLGSFLWWINPHKFDDCTKLSMISFLLGIIVGFIAGFVA